jgi:hypothetical protein
VPLIGELEARIDEALVIARASEEGVREVGEMALDAARQARRAAEAAEESARAAAAVRARPAEVSGPAGPVTDLVPPPAAGAAGAASSGGSPKSVPPPGSDVEAGTPSAERDSSSEEEPGPVEEAVATGEPDPAPPVRFEVRFRRFSERADRVSARLRALQDHPSHSPAPSVAATRRRGDG